MTATKPSIKNLFEDFMNEIKGFKYEMTQKVLIKEFRKRI